MYGAMEARKSFQERYPFRTNPSLIDTLRPDDIYSKGNESFLDWVEYKTRDAGHIAVYSNAYAMNARNAPEVFKSLLRQAVDDSKSLAEKVDANWGSIHYFGEDKHIAKKIINLFYPEETVPIFNTEHMEHFLRALGEDYESQAKKTFGENYTSLTIGRKYQLLTETLLKAKKEVNSSWSNQEFGVFLYRHLSPYTDHNKFDFIEYGEKNADKILFWRISGWPEHMITCVEKNVWGIDPELEDRLKDMRNGHVIIVYMNKRTGSEFRGFEVQKGGIIAAGIVGDAYVKEVKWWLNEFDSNENRWLRILPFNQLLVVSNSIDRNNPIDKKDEATIQREIDSLSSNCVTLPEVSSRTEYNFPIQGSISRIPPKVGIEIIKMLYERGATLTSPDERREKLRRVLESQRSLLKPEWDAIWTQSEDKIREIKQRISSGSRIDPDEIDKTRKGLPTHLRNATDYVFGVSDIFRGRDSVNDPVFVNFLRVAAGAKNYADIATTLKNTKVKGARISVLSTWASFLRPDLFMPIWKGVLGTVSQELQIERFVGDDSDPDEYLAFMNDILAASKAVGISNLFETTYYLMTYRPFEETYLLLRAQPGSEWKDLEGSVYHFGTNVPNFTKLRTGVQVIFDRNENGVIVFTGYGKIGKVEGIGQKIEGERSYFERLAHLEEYQKYDPQIARDEAIKRKLESLPNYNNQNSIRVITKEIFREVTGQAPIPEQLDAFQKIAVAHLLSGKNLVLYGAPGTGKTRTAVSLCQSYLKGKEGEAYSIETANAEWTHSDVVIGFRPKGRGFEPTSGILTRASEECWKRLSKSNLPFWLIIDELNRANLDLAFGKVFTLLDVDYRDAKLLDMGEYFTSDAKKRPSPLFVPYSFRILATMNVQDRALLFALGYAFMRRFAFVKVPSQVLVESGAAPRGQVSPTSQLAKDMLTEAAAWLLSADGRRLKGEIGNAILAYSIRVRNKPATDMATIEKLDFSRVITAVPHLSLAGQRFVPTTNHFSSAGHSFRRCLFPTMK